MALTLSVNEILRDVLPAFKTETPELFGPRGFATNFKSATAVLGDTVTARIDKLPVTGAYDPNTGFAAASQDVSTLFEDIPVTLNRIPTATIKFPWLVRAASKLDPDYKRWVKALGGAIGRRVLGEVFDAAAANVTHQFVHPLAAMDVDGFELLRDSLNGQHVEGDSRFCFVNTPLASALGADDRVRSEQFYGQANGERGWRRWTDVAGFNSIRELGDFNEHDRGYQGLAGDRRLVAVCARGLETPQAAVEALRIPKVMNFYPILDEESELSLTAITWQQSGTADIFVSVGLLLGMHVGNGGGAASTKTDDAGCLVRTI